MIRRFAALALIVLLLGGCAPTEPPQTEETAQTVPLDPLQAAMSDRLTVAAVQELSIATADMTKAELRQLCLDYFRLQLSFQWTPSVSFTDYRTTYMSGVNTKALLEGSVYGGIPYQSKGTGNLYRWLEYYDEETGVLDIEKAMAENGGDAKYAIEYNSSGKETYYIYRWMQALFNQCSVASFWGWGRVINSANFAWTSEMNVCNGFIPVGDFTYGYTHEGKYYDAKTIRAFGTKESSNPIGYDTKDVIADWVALKGSNAMYQCYAQLQPADCLVNQGHAMMVESVRLSYNADGSVNYKNSTVTVLEQVEGWTKELRLGETKIPYKVQGQINGVYSFAQLQSKGYLPFTFAEFLEAEDPRLDTFTTSVQGEYSTFMQAGISAFGADVEPSEVYCTTRLGSVTVKQFAKLKVGSNYPISDVFVIVTDAEGNQVLKNIYRAANARRREVSMGTVKSTWETVNGETADICYGLEAFADGNHHICVRLQLSTGEIKEAFRAVLSGG